MLTHRRMIKCIQPRDWFAAIDLKDAYFHVSILPRHRPFLRKRRVLPFGLSLSPRVFTKVAEVALAPLWEVGIRILNCLEHGPRARTVVRSQGPGASAPQPVGASGQLRKEQALPCAENLFSWCGVDSVSMTARLTEECTQSVLNCLSLHLHFTFMHLADAFIQSDLHCIQAIHFFVCMCVPWELNPQPFALLTQCSTTEPQEHSVFLQRQDCGSAETVSEAPGAYGSCSHAARIASYETTSALVALPSPEVGMAPRCTRVNITQECRRSFSPWTDLAFLRAGVPLEQVSRHVVVTTDASSMGWGATCNGQAASGLWTGPRLLWHINTY